MQHDVVLTTSYLVAFRFTEVADIVLNSPRLVLLYHLNFLRVYWGKDKICLVLLEFYESMPGLGIVGADSQ